MAQTTKKGNIYYPDGAVLAVKADGEAVYTDVGIIMTAIATTLNYDVNEVNTANGDKLDRQVKNMTAALSFTLGNLEPASLVRLGGGVLTKVDTAGSPIATIPDQTIAAGWADQTLIPLTMVVSSSDSTVVRTVAAPTLTSVTLDPTGTPEVLVEDTDYVVVSDTHSPSGWSLQTLSANMGTGSPTTFEIVIIYDTNTPIANTTVYAGQSTLVMADVAIQVTHTDDDGLIRRMTLYSGDIDSGGLVFSFKGANEEGIEEMPIAFTGKPDTSLTSGRQLISWTVEDGAA